MEKRHHDKSRWRNFRRSSNLRPRERHTTREREPRTFIHSGWGPTNTRCAHVHTMHAAPRIAIAKFLRLFGYPYSIMFDATNQNGESSGTLRNLTALYLATNLLATTVQSERFGYPLSLLLLFQGSCDRRVIWQWWSRCSSRRPPYTPIASTRFIDLSLDFPLIYSVKWRYWLFKVHNIVLYPDKHSWCKTTPIKQVVTWPQCSSQELDNNVCVGACFSYMVPHSEPSAPGDLIRPYCDSCQPLDSVWHTVGE